jgi:protein tyrosine phosphatase
MNAAAIVRLGQLKGYLRYCPLDSSFEYDQLTISPAEEKNLETLFDTTTCTQFSVKYNKESRSFSVYAVEGWEDFGTNQYPEIHQLILEIDRLTGPVIIHCRGGFGRTGSLACCWKIYQEFKAAKLEGNPIEIDPVAIIDEMRDVRTALVQNDEQFEMILGYINYLNVFINEE